MMNDLDRANEALELYQAARSERITPDHAKILALVKAGVDVKATGNNNHTLLHWAAYYEHLEVCERLIEQGTKIDARSSLGNTSLHKAAMNGHSKIVKLLLEQGADIHARSDDGDTPLHFAALFDKPKLTRFLLAQGANIWANNNDDKTVLFFDETDVIESQFKLWMPKLEKVKDEKFGGINSTQDLYHLASMKQPADPKDIPHPKEFIRILFQQYLPYEPKFNAMYEEIFAEPRAKPLDLQSARAAAQRRGVVL